MKIAAVVAGTEKQRCFIADDRAVSNVIIGEEKNLPKMTPTDKGHFHGECRGNISYRIEGLPDLVADVGAILQRQASLPSCHERLPGCRPLLRAEG